MRRSNGWCLQGPPISASSTGLGADGRYLLGDERVGVNTCRSANCAEHGQVELGTAADIGERPMIGFGC